MIAQSTPQLRVRSRQITAPPPDTTLHLAKTTARDVLRAVIDCLDSPAGLHPETAFTLIGALAGHTAAEIGWARRRGAGDGFNPHDIQSFTEIRMQTGQRYILGNWINDSLTDGDMSFASLVIAGAAHFGAADLPDIQNIAINTVQRFGTDSFGIPRLPKPHWPAQPPLNLLRRYGPAIAPVLADHCDRAALIPPALAFAAQTLMRDTCDRLDPGMAAHILIESAFPIARMHPDDI